MRKSLFILLSFLCFSCTRSIAQWYLKPYAGIGLTNVMENYPLLASYPTSTPITGYIGVLGIGYKHNRWRFETGLGYVRTGKKISPVLYSLPGSSPVVLATDLRFAFQHIVLPLRVALKVPLSKKLSLVPALGIQVSYNTGGTYLYETGGVEKREKFNNFDMAYNQLGLFAEAQLHATYSLNKHLEIFAGPSFQYMASSISKSISTPIFFYSVKEHPYAAMLLAGVNIHFARHRTPVAPGVAE